jgi:hypothetical protein
MARPKGSSKYGAEIVERICAEIAVEKSMREICRARLFSRETATEVEWITCVSMPRLSSQRASQKPSRPAS